VAHFDHAARSIRWTLYRAVAVAGSVKGTVEAQCNIGLCNGDFVAERDECEK
jgi:hypothetical protein